jgi:phosphoglycolate phosphatase-like HAD superfamily hydrolase
MTPEAQPSSIRLENWDAVIFDCDGVLLDSNWMKVHAFVHTLEALGVAESTRAAFSLFQRNNFGISRHKLFAELLNERFGLIPADLSLPALLAGYGSQCKQGYLRAPATRGMQLLLTQLAGRPLFVASGSEEEELRQVFELRDLTRYFHGIYGSPTPKTQLLANIRMQLPAATRFVMLGDAVADYQAAQDNQMDFICVCAYSTVRETMLTLARSAGFPVVESLENLLDPTRQPT